MPLGTCTSASSQVLPQLGLQKLFHAPAVLSIKAHQVIVKLAKEDLSFCIPFVELTRNSLWELSGLIPWCFHFLNCKTA
jgi:hypothetical protein